MFGPLNQCTLIHKKIKINILIAYSTTKNKMQKHATMQKQVKNVNVDM